MIPIFIGYDTKETICYHVAAGSITRASSQPVSLTPLNLTNFKGYTEQHYDFSNTSVYTRFLVPHLMDYTGWAIYMDCDVVVQSDIADLWNLRDESKALMCVQHEYNTSANVKFLGAPNEDYPRKNWSSVMLINCGHPANKLITPSVVETSTGSFLHQFQWLPDNLIGELPTSWNWLVSEYPVNYEADLLHYTLGAPCFAEYSNCEMSDVWHGALEYINIGQN